MKKTRKSTKMTKREKLMLANRKRWIAMGDDAPLTDLEKKALRAVYNSALGNGLDFGFTEDVIASCAKRGITVYQVGAVLSTLNEKGIIVVHEWVKTDRWYRQITFAQRNKLGDAGIKKMVEKMTK